jgi:hypothetical protein
MSARVIGWRYAMIASVSRPGALSRPNVLREELRAGANAGGNQLPARRAFPQLICASAVPAIGSISSIAARSCLLASSEGSNTWIRLVRLRSTLEDAEKISD